MPKATDPIRINTMELPHRFVVAPNGKGYADREGEVTDRLRESYRMEAEGAYGGMVQVGVAYVHLSGKGFQGIQALHSDYTVASHTRQATTIRLAGAKSSIQLFHAGAIAVPDEPGITPVSSVEMPLYMRPGKSRALEAGEIEGLIEAYGKAAERAKRAGYDAVNLHFTHGSLPMQFYSPFVNTRQDKWGKEPLLFPVKIIDRVRRGVGKDYPIIARISAHEYMEDQGYDLEYAATKVAPAFVEAGADCIDVSAGRIGLTSGAWLLQPLYFPRGCIIHLAEEVKRQVNVPVIAVGKLMDPRLAEKIIEDGKADLVSFCRPMTADTDFIKKALTGRRDEIRKCIGCNWCSMTVAVTNIGVKCAVNATYGKELEYLPLRKAEEPRRIVVIGGGPGGMEVARVAASRKHEVTLYEKTPRLGGLVNVASAHPRLNTKDLFNIVGYQITMLKKLGVKVVLGREVTPDLVEELRPDVVVVATGSRPRMPEIPGLDRSIVMTNDDYLTMGLPFGQKVVVLGGHEGAETALSLAREKKEVTLVEESPAIANPPYMVDIFRRHFLVEVYLKEVPVRVMTDTKVKEILDGGVVVVGKEGKEETLEAEMVILALGRVPNNELVKLLKGKVPELYQLGDCIKPRSIGEAIEEAFYIAQKI